MNMSMYKLNCPTCLVEKPQSAKHVRQIELKEDKKFFACHQCHHEFEVVLENAEHVVIGKMIN